MNRSPANDSRLGPALAHGSTLASGSQPKLVAQPPADGCGWKMHSCEFSFFDDFTNLGGASAASIRNVLVAGHYWLAELRETALYGTNLFGRRCFCDAL